MPSDNLSEIGEFELGPYAKLMKKGPSRIVKRGRGGGAIIHVGDPSSPPSPHHLLVGEVIGDIEHLSDKDLPNNLTSDEYGVTIRTEGPRTIVRRVPLGPYSRLMRSFRGNRPNSNSSDSPTDDNFEPSCLDGDEADTDIEPHETVDEWNATKYTCNYPTSNPSSSSSMTIPSESKNIETTSTVIMSPPPTKTCPISQSQPTPLPPSATSLQSSPQHLTRMGIPSHSMYGNQSMSSAAANHGWVQPSQYIMNHSLSTLPVPMTQHPRAIHRVQISGPIHIQSSQQMPDRHFNNGWVQNPSIIQSPTPLVVVTRPPSTIQKDSLQKPREFFAESNKDSNAIMNNYIDNNNINIYSIQSNSNTNITNSTANKNKVMKNKPPTPAVPQITNTFTPKRIECSIPSHASSVFHILDRRIQMDSFSSDISLYSLVRAWVQDDPCRVIPPPELLLDSSRAMSEKYNNDDDSNSSKKNNMQTKKQSVIIGGDKTCTNTTTPSIWDVIPKDDDDCTNTTTPSIWDVIPKDDDDDDSAKNYIRPTWKSLQEEHVQRAKQIHNIKKQEDRKRMRRISKKLKSYIHNK